MARLGRHGERGTIHLALLLFVPVLAIVGILFVAVLVITMAGGSAASASRTGSVQQKDIQTLNGKAENPPDPDLGGQVIEQSPGQAKLVCAFIPGISYPRTNALDWRAARRWQAAKAELDSQGLRITANYAFRTSCQQSQMRGTYGIAAPPGSSMHESGCAVDINGIGTKQAGAKYGVQTALGQRVIPILEKYGWHWLPFDPMHVEVRAFEVGETDKYTLIRKEQQDFDSGDPTGGCRGDRCHP